MNPTKTAASRQLHRWAADNSLTAVSTTNVADGRRKQSGRRYRRRERKGTKKQRGQRGKTKKRKRGHAATFQLKTLGADGKIKRVQLDYTFANERMSKLVRKVENRWFPGQAKWAHEHYDHALQAVTLRLRLDSRREANYTSKLKTFYKDEQNAAELQRQYHELPDPRQCRHPSGMVAELEATLAGAATREDALRSLDTAYHNVTHKLGIANEATHKAKRRRTTKESPHPPSNPTLKSAVEMLHRVPEAAEWQITADMYKVLSDRDQHRRAAEREGVSLTLSQRQAYATNLKKAALAAMKQWVTHNVKKLRAAAKNGRKQEFYDHWKRMVRRGRIQRGAARFYQPPDGPPTTTVEQEGDGWAGYMEGKYQEHHPGHAARSCHDWDPVNQKQLLLQNIRQEFKKKRPIFT
eukprot:SAG31_NODE_957_length_10768_cov_3.322992_11_plen_409_part_00